MWISWNMPCSAVLRNAYDQEGQFDEVSQLSFQTPW